jgi:hypothetical protein
MKVLVVGSVKSGSSAIAYRIREQLALLEAKPYELVFEPYTLRGLQVLPDSVVKYVRPHDREDLAAAVFAYDHRVVIVRHPLSILVSLALFCGNNQPAFGDGRIAQGYLELLQRKERAPDAAPFRLLIDYLLRDANYDLMREVVQHSKAMAELVVNPAFTVVRYEDVEAGVDLSLGDLRIRLTLDVDLGFERGFIARQGASSDWENYLLPEDLPAITRQIPGVLTALGYQSEPTTQSRKIDASKCSEYFVSTLNRRRADAGLRPFTPGKIGYGAEGAEMLGAFRTFRASPAEAFTALEGLIERRPDLIEPRYLWALLKKLTAKESKDDRFVLISARRMLNSCLKIEPANDDVLTLMVQISYILGRHRTVLSLTQRIGRQSPETERIVRKSTSNLASKATSLARRRKDLGSLLD